MSAPDGSASVSAARSALRCVIWHSAQTALPGELLSSLSKRIGHMSVTTDGYTAFAQVCTIERERRSAQAAGIPPAHAAVLLLVHPGTLAGATAVVAAARLYAPTCSIWQYDRVAGVSGAAANPRLRAVVEEDVRRWGAGAAALVGSSAQTSQPRAPLTEQSADRTAGTDTTNGISIPPNMIRNGKHPVPTSHSSTPSSANTSPAARARSPIAPALTHLTEDELRMLLSDDPVFPPGQQPPQNGAGGRR